MRTKHFRPQVDKMPTLLEYEKEEKGALEIIQYINIFSKKEEKGALKNQKIIWKNGRGKRRVDVFHIFGLVEKGALVN